MRVDQRPETAYHQIQQTDPGQYREKGVDHDQKRTLPGSDDFHLMTSSSSSFSGLMPRSGLTQRALLMLAEQHFWKADQGGEQADEPEHQWIPDDPEHGFPKALLVAPVNQNADRELQQADQRQQQPGKGRR